MNLPSVNVLNDLFRLDEHTGVLYWRVRTARRTRVGDEAGALNKVTGYRHVRVEGRLFATHRVVFAMAHGRWPATSIDHINGNRLDNRPINLREASPSQQGMNKCRQSNNTSEATGVVFHRGANKWAAKIQANRKSTHLGLFNSFEDAVLARAQASDRIFGEFNRRER